MARKKSSSPSPSDTKPLSPEPTMSDVLTGGDAGDGDSLFVYDDSIEDAVAPEALHDGAKVFATVKGVKLQTSDLTGKPQLIFNYLVEPDDYPADFPTDHYPEGIPLINFSAPIGNSVPGRFNQKKIALAHGAPTVKELRATDYIGKRVKVTIKLKNRDDGTKQMLVAAVEPASSGSLA